ncbi:MAG: UDP-N-acetylmuramoyl-tripeptide--D-alanyl-D-alanine ligase [Simkaniaceae bacterium]|nr:UDP-N-acetylmuramoyl-tripeptide--D-alanyl-D-alanine ligase [Simkaniaceae bacterium]
MIEKSLVRIARLLGHSVEREIFLSSATCDSRQVLPGGLFFALKGERCDGHHFLAEVRDRGGVAAVVSHGYRGGPSCGLILLFVDCPGEALCHLAKEVHRRNPPYVIGVTGTVGKTTTKDFIATLFAQKYPVAKSPGNANSRIGLPLAILNRGERSRICVLEMGMSQPGDLTKLTSIAPPDFGVLTKVGFAHAENFCGLEEIATAKMELFTRVRRGVFHHSTMVYEAVARSPVTKTLYAGTSCDVDYYLREEPSGHLFVHEGGGSGHDVHLPFTESHFRENALCAIATARLHGLTWDEIRRGARLLTTSPGRFRLVRRGGITYVDDAYNASVDSMKAAFDNLPPGRKTVAVLGGMKELGVHSVRCHEEVARYALPKTDRLICIGKEARPMVALFRREGKPADLVGSLREIEEKLRETIAGGDVVLIKGSHAFGLQNLFGER